MVSDEIKKERSNIGVPMALYSSSGQSSVCLPLVALHKGTAETRRSARLARLAHVTFAYCATMSSHLHSKYIYALR